MEGLWKKYKSLFYYALFGVLTTLINIVSYVFCYNVLKIPNVPSNVVAWILAVAFAYVTNKIWVFESKKVETADILDELWKFVSCRLATGGLDLAIMFVGVDLMQAPSTWVKIGSNILVIVLNYVLSRWIVFSSGGKSNENPSKK